VDRFLESEKKEHPDKGVDPDILAEMHRPIQMIKKEIPSVLQKYTVARIIDACIKKKAHNTIKTNREFRFLTKSLAALKDGRVRPEVMEEKLIEFIRDVDISPEKVYEATSEIIYQLKAILEKSQFLFEELQNLDLRKLTEAERTTLAERLNKLHTVIREKIVK